MTLSTFPNAERATKTERTRSALFPNMFLKKVAATIRPERTISALGTAAKYAIWDKISNLFRELDERDRLTLVSMYRIDTRSNAAGAARFNVWTGFFVSERA